MAAKKPAHALLLVHVTDRLKKAPSVQKSLSSFGDAIRTRLGLHEIGEGYSSPEGVLVLDIAGEARAKELKRALDGIEGIESKLVVFRH